MILCVSVFPPIGGLVFILSSHRGVGPYGPEAGKGERQQKYPVKFMSMKSEVYPVELLRRSTRRDSTGTYLTGVPKLMKHKELTAKIIECAYKAKAIS